MGKKRAKNWCRKNSVLHLAKRSQISPCAEQTVCKFKSYCTPWNQLWILAVSLSVSSRGSNEICVSQNCQDLNQQWIQTPASEIYISWQMRGRVCAPGWALVHSSPVLLSGRLWEMWKQSVRPRSCVNYTHWAVFGSFCSCWAVLCCHISIGHISFSLVIALPPSPQFAIHERSVSAPWGRTQTLSLWPCQSVTGKMSSFHSQMTMSTQWQNQGHHLHKKQQNLVQSGKKIIT